MVSAIFVFGLLLVCAFIIKAGYRILLWIASYEDGIGWAYSASSAYEVLCLSGFAATVALSIRTIYLSQILELQNAFSVDVLCKVVFVGLPVMSVLIYAATRMVLYYAGKNSTGHVNSKSLTGILLAGVVCAVLISPAWKWTFRDASAELISRDIASSGDNLFSAYAESGISNNRVLELLNRHPNTPAQIQKIGKGCDGKLLSTGCDSTVFSYNKTTFDYKLAEKINIAENLSFLLMGFLSYFWIFFHVRRENARTNSNLSLTEFRVLRYSSILTFLIGIVWLIWILAIIFSHPDAFNGLLIITMLVIALPFWLTFVLPLVYLLTAAFAIVFVPRERTIFTFMTLSLSVIPLVFWFSIWVAMQPAREDILSREYWKSMVAVRSVESAPELLCKIYSGPYGHNKEIAQVLAARNNTPQTVLLKMIDDFKSDNDILMALAVNPRIPDSALLPVAANTSDEWVLGKVLGRASNSCGILYVILSRPDMDKLPFHISKSACDSYRQLDDKCQVDNKKDAGLLHTCELIDKQIALHEKNSRPGNTQ